MAFTDIRLLRIYNNKPPKNNLSLYTDDIRGAKPRETIHELDPQGKEKYMNSTLKRVDSSTSSIKPMYEAITQFYDQ
jgi:hypothetical protein